MIDKTIEQIVDFALENEGVLYDQEVFITKTKILLQRDLKTRFWRDSKEQLPFTNSIVLVETIGQGMNVAHYDNDTKSFWFQGGILMNVVAWQYLPISSGAV